MGVHEGNLQVKADVDVMMLEKMSDNYSSRLYTVVVFVVHTYK